MIRFLLTYFLTVILWLFPATSYAQEFHVLMVSPRGQQRTELAFMKEFQSLYKGNTKFTFIVPNINDSAEMSNLPDKVRRMKPNLIFTFGTPTTLAIAGTVEKPIINDIPIAFSTVTYPIQSRIISASKDNPRANIVGTSHMTSVEMHFEMMMKFKKFSSIGVAYNPTESQTQFMLDDLTKVARKFNVNLYAETVDTDDDGAPDPKSIPAKIQSLKKMGAEWLYIGPDTFMGFTHKDATTIAALNNNMLSFTIGEHPIRYSYAAFGVVSRLEELGRFTAFKAFEVFVKKNKLYLGADTMYKYDIVANQCALDQLRIQPSVDISHLIVFLTSQNGECKPLSR